MHKETQNKIELINKYFKKDNNIIELSLINYEGYNIYIRLDELKSTKTFKLSWFDLDLILDKNIDIDARLNILTKLPSDIKGYFDKFDEITVY